MFFWRTAMICQINICFDNIKMSISFTRVCVKVSKEGIVDINPIKDNIMSNDKSWIGDRLSASMMR